MNIGKRINAFLKARIEFKINDAHNTLITGVKARTNSHSYNGVILNRLNFFHSILFAMLLNTRMNWLKKYLSSFFIENRIIESINEAQYKYIKEVIGVIQTDLLDKEQLTTKRRSQCLDMLSDIWNDGKKYSKEMLNNRNENHELIQYVKIYGVVYNINKNTVKDDKWLDKNFLTKEIDKLYYWLLNLKEDLNTIELQKTRIEKGSDLYRLGFYGLYEGEDTKKINKVNLVKFNNNLPYSEIMMNNEGMIIYIGGPVITNQKGDTIGGIEVFLFTIAGEIRKFYFMEDLVKFINRDGNIVQKLKDFN